MVKEIEAEMRKLRVSCKNILKIYNTGSQNIFYKSCYLLAKKIESDLLK